ncbi:MAG: ankyrin repeat domain-containing protein [Verrucomicrobiota bacterium]
MIDHLSAAGVRVEMPPAGEPTVLETVVQTGAWELLPKLLPLCAPELVNHPGTGGRTVLETSIAADRADMAELLLNAGASPANAADADALLAKARSHPLLLDRLISLLPLGHPALSGALLPAIQGGETARVNQLLARGAHPESKNQYGASVLTLSCAAGHLEITDSLLKAGAKPASSPAALQRAVEQKDTALCKRLLEAGADPSRPADPARPEITPLTTALATGGLPMLDQLLTPSSPSAICYAAALIQGKPGLLELLFKHKIPADQPMSDGNPPLVKAAIEGKTEMISSLLAHGAVLETPGALGQTAYHMAVIHKQNAAVTLLLEAGMKADTPFRKPAPAELIPLFDNEYFAKWYGKDDHLTPLMLAASRGDGPMIRLLLDGGAKRGAQTREWHRYPIVFACDNAQISAAQLLLGRDPDAETERRSVVISLSRQKVSLFKNDVLVRSSSVSTGRKANPTPPGKYVITDKQVDWTSSIYKVPMPYFMRLSCKEIGLHQGVVPGYPASHGCIRMPKGDVQAFFKTLKIGDPVTIEE